MYESLLDQVRRFNPAENPTEHLIVRLGAALEDSMSEVAAIKQELARQTKRATDCEARASRMGSELARMQRWIDQCPTK